MPTSASTTRAARPATSRWRGARTSTCRGPGRSSGPDHRDRRRPHLRRPLDDRGALRLRARRGERGPGLARRRLRPPGEQRKGIIQHERGHKNHLHVRFFNPRAQEYGRIVYPMLVEEGACRRRESSTASRAARRSATSRRATAPRPRRSAPPTAARQRGCARAGSYLIPIRRVPRTAGRSSCRPAPAAAAAARRRANGVGRRGAGGRAGARARAAAADAEPGSRLLGRDPLRAGRRRASAPCGRAGAARRRRRAPARGSSPLTKPSALACSSSATSGS